jgi:carboxypeptidase T
MNTIAIVAVALLAASAHADIDPRFDGKPGDPLPFVNIEAPTPASTGVDSRVWVQFATPGNGKAARDIAADSGISIEEIMPGQSAGIATPEDVELARKAGVKILSAISLEQRFGALDFPEKDSIYHNYDRTVKALDAIAASAPDVVSKFSIGKSLQGKDLWALRLTRGAKGAAASAKPGIVFLGTHHAREHLSTEIPLMLAKHLADNRAQPEIAKLLDTRDIYIIPMVNPDGVEYDISDGKYHMHRKNMAPNHDGTTGVDLNRNYGYGWGGKGASSNPNNDTYRGPSAFSEPETQAVKAFVESHKNLKILLSYHTFSELILYPWGRTNDPLDDKPAHDAYIAMGAEMGKMTGYKPQQASSLYIVSGDTCDWAWGQHKIFCFTFELTPTSMWEGGFYPGPEAIATTFQTNIRPALYLIDLADNPMRATRGQSIFAATPTKPTVGGALQ